MKRTGIRRKSELKRGGFEKMKRGHPTNARSKGLPKVNRKRKAKRQAEQFGSHAHYIRSLPCCIGIGCTGRVQAAHVKSRGAGGKARDLVPMCAGHHWEEHAVGRETFWYRNLVDLTAIAAELWATSPYNTDDAGEES